MPGKSRIKWLTIIGIALPFLFLGSCVWMISGFVQEVTRPPEIAEGVSSVDWLPEEATNISYYLSYCFTAYEFKISEEGFREWAATETWAAPSDFLYYQPLAEVAGLEEKPFFPIDRYNTLQVEEPKSLEELDPHRKATSIEIEDGLWGQMRKHSAGGYSIGYDRGTGTAYWQSNPR